MQHLIQMFQFFHTVQTLLVCLPLSVHQVVLEIVLVGQRPLILKYEYLQSVNLERVEPVRFEIVLLVIVGQLN